MRTLALIVFACGSGSAIAHGQVSATFEGGISAVRYDGFVASGAAALTPTLQWQHPGGRGFLTARGTYLRFESGHRSLDGSVNGSWFTGLGRHWRGEVGAALGASDYANIASFTNAALDARLHRTDGDHGAWLGATLGGASFGAGTRPVAVVALGMWLLRSNLTLFTSVDRSFVGDTAYSDLRTSARVGRAPLLLEGTLGARVLSRGGGRGVYGEATATWTLGRHTAFLLSAGRYPTDAVSGSIAGRYVTAALRVGVTGMRRPVLRSFDIDGIRGSGAADDLTASGARLEIQTYQSGEVVLQVYAPGAAAVELSGDFTNWQPMTLTRTSATGDVWVGRFRIAPGMHRVNVRRDGGPWLAPAGTMRSTDDYDGDVGVFVLP